MQPGVACYRACMVVVRHHNRQQSLADSLAELAELSQHDDTLAPLLYEAVLQQNYKKYGDTLEVCRLVFKRFASTTTHRKLHQLEPSPLKSLLLARAKNWMCVCGGSRFMACQQCCQAICDSCQTLQLSPRTTTGRRYCRRCVRSVLRADSILLWPYIDIHAWVRGEYDEHTILFAELNWERASVRQRRRRGGRPVQVLPVLTESPPATSQSTPTT